MVSLVMGRHTGSPRSWRQPVGRARRGELFFDKLPSTTASGVPSFSNASGDVLSRDFVVTAEHERSVLRHDREEPKDASRTSGSCSPGQNLSEIALIATTSSRGRTVSIRPIARGNIEWESTCRCSRWRAADWQRSPDRTRLACPDRIRRLHSSRASTKTNRGRDHR